MHATSDVFAKTSRTCHDMTAQREELLSRRARLRDEMARLTHQHEVRLVTSSEHEWLEPTPSKVDITERSRAADALQEVELELTDDEIAVVMAAE